MMKDRVFKFLANPPNKKLAIKGDIGKKEPSKTNKKISKEYKKTKEEIKAAETFTASFIKNNVRDFCLMVSSCPLIDNGYRNTIENVNRGG